MSYVSCVIASVINDLPIASRNATKSQDTDFCIILLHEILNS
jgi:hypothetical protein